MVILQYKEKGWTTWVTLWYDNLREAKEAKAYLKAQGFEVRG
jgi:hypothetical protein